ncbi:MAG: patatin-like phospholipase family protein [Trueperaceae bacterium]|nr:patatin-like phospholipase family protein [Trueperaceae bacterium]
MNHETQAPRIGLALGSGGAGGLAHILMLEAFDELGIRPHHIVGTSIGAIIGALYAAGIPGSRIRGIAADLVIRDGDTWREVFGKRDHVFSWARLVRPRLGRGGLVSAEDFLASLYAQVEQQSFEELQIPLSVVATDLWAREAVVYDTGPFRPAVEASSALPGLIKPVTLDDRVLIDGGAVNPLPWDVLSDDCDVTVAVDVTGSRTRTDDLSPLETIFNTFIIMQGSIAGAKRTHAGPDIYIDSGISDIRALEFHRIEEIFVQAEPARDELKRQLAELPGTNPAGSSSGSNS